MKYSFFRKIVVITGASSGIGKRMAETFINEYECTVYAIARNETKLSAVKKSLGDKGNRFFFFAFDVGEEAEWKRFAAGLAGAGVFPDVLVNCAGILPAFEKFERSAPSIAEAAIKTNYLAQVYATCALLPLLKKNLSPAVINFSSSSALCPFAGVAAYCASKAASERFTECFAAEERGVYVASVMPGFVATDIMRNQVMTERDSRLVARLSADCGRTVRVVFRRLSKRRKGSS